MGCSRADLWQAETVNTKIQQRQSTYTRTILPSLPTTGSLFSLEKCFAAFEAIAPERFTTRAIRGRAILVVGRLCQADATRVGILFERDYEGLRRTSYVARQGEGECGQRPSSFLGPGFNVRWQVGRSVRSIMLRVRVRSMMDGHCLKILCGSTTRYEMSCF